MSTKDQLLYSALHGTAMRYAAERRNLDESIQALREIAAAETTFRLRQLASRLVVVRVAVHPCGL